jgi:DNA-binding transcriptional ArsR family regulator
MTDRQMEPASGLAPPARHGGAFAKVYRDLSTSGLLSELSGSQLKVLLALALDAHVLGDARHPAGERLSSRPYEGHFQRLRRLGVVIAADRGRLLCCLDRDTIAQRTGLDRRTVTRATNALAERHLLEKRRVRNRKGWHDSVYFVRSSSCLAKFDAGPPSAPLQGRGHALLVVVCLLTSTSRSV